MTLSQCLRSRVKQTRPAGKAAFPGNGSAAFQTETLPNPGSGDPAVEYFPGVLGQHLARLGVVAEHGEQARVGAFDRGHPVQRIAAALRLHGRAYLGPVDLLPSAPTWDPRAVGT